MKKQFLAAVAFFFLFSSFGQTKVYRKYGEYRVKPNIDSLQMVIDSQKNQPTLILLHSLIELEISRNFYSNDFGKDLEKIKTVALKNNDQQALAMYNLFKAIKFAYSDHEQSLSYVLKAKTYFEQQKDTSGILCSNDLLIFRAYLYSDDHQKKKKILPIFENSLSYYNQVKDTRDKLRIIITVLRNADILDMNIQKRLAFLNEGIKILDRNKDPQYNSLYYSFYSVAADAYKNIPDKKGDYLRHIQNFYLKAYYILNEKQGSMKISALSDLSDSYIATKDFKQAEVYIKQAIALYEKIKEDDISELLEIYNKLSIIQYNQKDYKNAYQTRLKAEEIEKTMNEKLKIKESRELLTKYDTEKKDVLIKNLELQKQVTETRTRLVLFILVLTCLIIAVVSYFALRLREANKNLKKLTQSRDKLFTVISHDLRSPFNSYQRYSEIVGHLIKTKQFDRLQEVLKKVDELGLNLAALLNNLLEWSIVQQKQIRITPSVINIQTFFNDLLPIYRDMARLKSLSLVEVFQDQAIKIDTHLLSLITRNLLDNAIKYTPEGNKIILQTAIKEDNFVMTISNRGGSMTAVQIEKIRALFNNYYDYEFGEDGLGIGLILIKEFARTNAVVINFNHSSDSLTTFEVIVPHVFF